MNSSIRSIIILLSVSSVLCNCGTNTGSGNSNAGKNTDVIVKIGGTVKGQYKKGDIVKISFSISNRTATPLSIGHLTVRIRNISRNGPFVKEMTPGKNFELPANGQRSLDSLGCWKVPLDAADDAYGIYIGYKVGEDTITSRYASFFRVVSDSTLTTFVIKRYSYHGLPVYALDGGMSAEYCVEKAIENLSDGISATWDVSAPGSGPRPVFATPDFLQMSVDRTVQYYNEYLGDTTGFETVIISTGIDALPYVSKFIRAPILPLHFLASANSIKEIRSVMDNAARHGLKAYSTLGYDGSVDPAVAWIKLLDLPPAYLDFIRNHRVRNVLIVGQSPTDDGETLARKVIDSSTSYYAPGSIFILHPGNSHNDDSTLRRHLVDFDETPMAKFSRVSDWECGIIPEQISQFRHSLKTQTSVSVWSLTSADLGKLYDLGTVTSLAFLKMHHIPLKGLAINPYLIAHPGYEWWRGYIPVIYWQGNGARRTVAHILGETKEEVELYFPETIFKQLVAWVNSSRNCDGEQDAGDMIRRLQQSAFSNIKKNNYHIDEVWDPADGMNAPCEQIAKEITTDEHAPTFTDWNHQMTPAGIRDLIPIVRKMPGMILTQQ